MKRREFIRTGIAGSVSLAAGQLYGQKTPDKKGPGHKLPQIPQIQPPAARVIPRIQQLADGGS